MTIVLVVGLVMTTGGNHPAGESSKSTIMHLTAQMLVDRSSFPDIAGGQWASGVAAQPTVDPQFRPAECGALLRWPIASEQGVAQLLSFSEHKGMTASVYLPTQRPDDARSIAHTCSTTQIDDIPNPRAEWTIESIDLRGIPEWAAAVRVNGRLDVFGTYRGVFVNIGCSPDLEDNAVKLFNDEVVKLEAA